MKLLATIWGALCAPVASFRRDHDRRRAARLAEAARSEAFAAYERDLARDRMRDFSASAAFEDIARARRANRIPRTPNVMRPTTAKVEDTQPWHSWHRLPPDAESAGEECRRHDARPTGDYP